MAEMPIDAINPVLAINRKAGAMGVLKSAYEYSVYRVSRRLIIKGVSLISKPCVRVPGEIVE